MFTVFTLLADWITYQLFSLPPDTKLAHSFSSASFPLSTPSLSYLLPPRISSSYPPTPLIPPSHHPDHFVQLPRKIMQVMLMP